MQDPLCARALPYQSHKEKSDDRYTLPAARCLDTRGAWDSVRASPRDRAGGGRHVARECHRRKRRRDSRRDDHRDGNAHEHQSHGRRPIEAGTYTFTNTPPGTYRVEGELVGFKKFTRENVEVSVNTTVRVEISLAVGTLEESVIVTGEAPMLQTDRTDTGRIIESTQITQMPLGFNRNFQALLITVPGASRPFRPHSEFYNSQDSLSSNVNGQGRQSNNVQLEGADNSDNGGNLAFMIPSAEAIETVAVTTSNYDAEFGRAGGAVTNVTLKSGTNQLPRLGVQFRQH